MNMMPAYELNLKIALHQNICVQFWIKCTDIEAECENSTPS